METPVSVLQRYWKHSQFRPLQEDIVNSVLQGNDTLALLPTGGGKSVCFQVPALLREGVCVVITPLIALMNDQVEQLKQRGIAAVAIHSGMSKSEIDLYLNNAMLGGVKFLYVSPERIRTDIFIERFKRMTVGLIAVDEAHCISQWGYDFRPPYLQIADLRKYAPDVPVIALTATATTQVRDDIMQKLDFRKQAKVFQKSFARDNLSFVVRKTENKDRKLLEILQKVRGTAIIYVRSRKATEELAKWLVKRNISASYYHAGLSFEDRTKRQEEWIRNKTRVMVATNAFGMGIDKPDVRLVIHLDLPENLEAYYQEAGRGGRDGLRAFAVIIYQDADINNLLKKTEQSHPTVKLLSKVYQGLANYYQLAVGSAEGESFDFDMHDFAERFKFSPIEIFNALKKLEEEELIQFSESFYAPSTLYIALNHQQLYEFQVANARFDPFIKMLLRLYGGELFTSFVKISEHFIARAMTVSYDEVIAQLKHLHSLKVLEYVPVKDKPQVTFLTPRQDAANLSVDRERIAARKELIMNKVKAMIGFATTEHRCRMQLVQDYFNEVTMKECGICDVCIKKRKSENVDAFEKLRLDLINILKNGSFAVDEIEDKLSPKDKELFVDVVRELVDEGTLEYDDVWRLRLAK